LPPNIPDAELAQSAEQRLGWKNSGLSPLLARAQVSTRVAKLPPREALDLVQQLEGWAAKLRIRPQIRPEKI
jgi:hypothetical protein